MRYLTLILLLSAQCCFGQRLNPYASLNYGLVGWWTMNEGIGTVAKDWGGYGNSGSLSNSPAWTSGVIGGSLSFDGTARLVNVPNTSSLDIETLSVCAWIKSTATSSGNIILEKWNQTGPYPYVFRTMPTTGYGAVACYDLTQNPGVVGTNIVTDGKWHHLVGTRIKGGAMSLYLDGAIQGTTTDNTSSTTKNGEPVFIGARGNYASPMNGLIDDVRIYSRALSSDEVRLLYNGGYGR